MGNLGIDVKQVVELYANLNVGETRKFELIDSYGYLVPFILSEGEVLVVTDVIVTPNTENGFYEGNIDNTPLGKEGATENRLRFRFNTENQDMLHLQLKTGLVFLSPPNAFSFATNPGGMVVRLLGYLASASCKI